jgi:hypothetical protein
VIEKLRGLRLSCAAELMETTVEETLAYYTFLEERSKSPELHSPYPIERLSGQPNKIPFS